MTEIKCPNCGQQILGYNYGDICSDCYEINETADEIMYFIKEVMGKVHLSSEAIERIQNKIKSEVRERFM